MSEKMELLLEELLREVRSQKESKPAVPGAAAGGIPHGVLLQFDHRPEKHDWKDLEHGDFGHPTGFYLGRKDEDHHPLDKPEFVGQLYDTAFNDLVPFVAMITHVYSQVEVNLVVWDHFGHQYHVVRARRGDPDNIVREKKDSGTDEQYPDEYVELHGISHVKRGDMAGWIPGRNIWYAPLQIGVA